MTFGLLELSILLFVVFVILGPKRVTNLLHALGRGIRDFKTEFTGDKETRALPEKEEEDGPKERD